MTNDPEKTIRELDEKEFHAKSKTHYLLIRFGDELAKEQKYKIHRGIDALHFYLVEKYHWLPYQVKALNNDDLRFLFVELRAS